MSSWRGTLSAWTPRRRRRRRRRSLVPIKPCHMFLHAIITPKWPLDCITYQPLYVTWPCVSQSHSCHTGSALNQHIYLPVSVNLIVMLLLMLFVALPSVAFLIICMFCSFWFMLFVLFAKMKVCTCFCLLDKNPWHCNANCSGSVRNWPRLHIESIVRETSWLNLLNSGMLRSCSSPHAQEADISSSSHSLLFPVGEKKKKTTQKTHL